MRKLILTTLMAAALVPGAALAQTGELRRDRQDIREEQRELRDARRHGDWKDVREERRDVRDARREYREDWRDYRRDNPRLYARGDFRAPFRYQRFERGYQLRPAYYRPRFYISDPYRYRLPEAGRGLRWVRHYDDALLVDVHNGRILRVERGFFF